MADIIIAEFMDEEAIALVPSRYDVVYDPKLVDEPSRLAGIMPGARALIVRNRTQVRGEVLDAATSLKVVGRLGVGLDNIDVEACKARGIAVCPASGANDIAVAEYVIGTAMLLLRNAYAVTDRVIAGAWPRNEAMGREVFGKVLGLVGFGSIARETTQRAAALGLNIIAYDPFVSPQHRAWTDFGVRPAPLHDVIARSDILSLHVPLNADTRNLIGAKALAAMKPGAVLINAARGGVVDEAALAEALKEGRIGGAALDVFNEEPLKAEQGARFAGLSNVVLTPHIAGVTIESNVRVSRVTIENVLRVLEA